MAATFRVPIGPEKKVPPARANETAAHSENRLGTDNPYAITARPAARQLSFDGFGALEPEPAGSTYDPGLDSRRLSGQLARVWALMLDGRWRTLAEIRDAVGGSEAGISARLRDFRKRQFGGHVVERRRRGDPRAGLYEYRLGVAR